MKTPVERFAAEYFVANRISAERQGFVLRALRMLSEANDGKPVEQLHDEHLRAFLASLVGRGLGVNTVRKFNHAIKPFYKWAWQARIIDADQYMRIKEVANPRGATAQGKPRPYKRTEIARFWTELDEAWPLVTEERLRRWRRGQAKYKHHIWRHAMHVQIEAAVSLALFGGLRRSEIHGLTVDDLHPDNDYIVVRGKTEIHDEPKIREVPFTEYGRELVTRWLQLRQDLGPTHDSPWLVLQARASANNQLAPSHPLNPMRAQTFGYLLSRVGPGWEWHRLRHTCATEWLRSGVELERVSKLLGHASIEQTLGYAALLRDDVQRSMRRNETAFIGGLRPAA